MAFPSSAERPIELDPDNYGIILGVFPSTETGFQVELQRHTTVTGSTAFARHAVLESHGEPLVFTDQLAFDNRTRTYRARHIRVGYSDGEWTAEVSGKPTDLSKQIIPDLGAEARRRIDTFRNQDGVVKGTVSKKEGVEALTLIAGHQAGEANGGAVSGGAWADGAFVTFPTSYAAPPRVRLYPESGVVTQEPDPTAWTSSGTFASTSRQYVELVAVNIQSGGFNPRARLIQRSATLTNRTHNYSTGNSLVVGQSTSVTLSNAPAYNDAYTVQYDLDMQLDNIGASQTVTAVVAELINGVERGTRSYQAVLETTASTASWANETITRTVSGITTTGTGAVQFKSLSVTPGSTADVTVTVHADHANYQTASTSAIYAAMCPTTNDKCRWEAYSGEAST